MTKNYEYLLSILNNALEAEKKARELLEPEIKWRADAVDREAGLLRALEYKLTKQRDTLVTVTAYLDIAHSNRERHETNIASLQSLIDELKAEQSQAS